MLRSHKVYIYTAAVMGISSISFFLSSQYLTGMLMDLDSKYEATYKKHIKDKNYEGIVWQNTINDLYK